MRVKRKLLDESSKSVLVVRGIQPRLRVNVNHTLTYNFTPLEISGVKL